jgi:hypothetical protein
LIGIVQVLILVVEVVEELQKKEEVVEVVEHFVMMMHDCYFHPNDLMIEVHRMAVVVGKNYFEMMNDCYMMVDHNVLAQNHIDEEHEQNY